jgi:hypothetical protein
MKGIEHEADDGLVVLKVPNPVAVANYSAAVAAAEAARMSNALALATQKSSAKVGE